MRNKPGPPQATPTQECPKVGCPCKVANHLILVATFTSTEGDEQTARKLTPSKWEPTTQDFRAVADWEQKNGAGAGCIVVQAVTNLQSWVDAIGKRPARSLAQVSLITHANARNLALSGTVSWKTGTVLLNTSQDFDDSHQSTEQANQAVLTRSGGLDTALLSGLGGRGWFDVAERGGATVTKVQAALAPGAIFNFYSCGSGNPGSFTNTQIFQKFADVFRVTVRGLSSSFIWYRPDWETQKLDRSKTGVGANETAGLATLAPGVFHDNGALTTLNPRPKTP